ncbi:MAG: helix-turn-helix domain-containing protein [Elainellaceae cyanobacterium]
MADHPKKKAALQSWLDGTSQRQVVLQQGISRATIQSWIKNDWKDMSPSMGKALAVEIVNAARDIDCTTTLENALRSLSADMNAAPVRSREGAATAIARVTLPTSSPFSVLQPFFFVTTSTNQPFFRWTWSVRH